MGRGERVGEQLAERVARAGPRAGAALRRARSGRHLGFDRHRGPFGRRRSPARPGTSTRPRLPSPCDASLSARRTCPAAGRGSGPGERPGGGEREAGCGRRRRRGGATHDAGAGGSRCRGAGRGRSAGRVEAGRGSGCRGRGGRRTKATGSIPPLSGPGARLVVKEGDSEGGAPEGSRVAALGPSTFRRAQRLRRGGERGPDRRGGRR